MDTFSRPCSANNGQEGISHNLRHMVDEMDHFLKNAADTGDQKFDIVRQRLTQQVMDMRAQLSAPTKPFKPTPTAPWGSQRLQDCWWDFWPLHADAACSVRIETGHRHDRRCGASVVDHLVGPGPKRLGLGPAGAGSRAPTMGSHVAGQPVGAVCSALCHHHGLGLAFVASRPRTQSELGGVAVRGHFGTEWCGALGVVPRIGMPKVLGSIALQINSWHPAFKL